ncbi:hypothetical protein ID866_10298 [Astraeus odoratus]|nr:hypothetical protein ID866_10298 [Astraeus odoratus]
MKHKEANGENGAHMHYCTAASLVSQSHVEMMKMPLEQWDKEASLDPNWDDDKATNELWKKVKEDRVKERAAERRQKHEEEEQRLQTEAEQKAWEEAERLARQEAKWKEEEEKAWRAGEAKQRAKEAEKAAEVQRRTAERQHKPSMVIPAGGSMHSWSKAAGGVIWKQRRMEAKGNDGEDDEKDNEDDSKGNFMVLLALVQEHRDMLSTLTTTLSTLLKEFKGDCHEQWDLHAHQVKGLKALQREMRKANALKAKELEATTKGKEKVTEVTEESLESSDEEEQAEGKGSKDGDRDGDVEMGVAPLASAM